jgi:hypothetical protein
LWPLLRAALRKHELQRESARHASANPLNAGTQSAQRKLHGTHGDVRLSLQDAFGAFMPRDHACIDPTASIVVKIVDT